MTDIMHGLLAEAKKSRYSTIKGNSDDDVAAVWESVSNFIDKQMSQQKAVQIPSFGTFTFSQKRLDIGNNKFILMQRPEFVIAEKLVQSQGLHATKHHIPGLIPVVQLNYAAMSFESPFDRDTVENCVREILSSFQRAVGARKNIELVFTGIGKLTIRDCKVKMIFYKDFINRMDGSGKLVDSMQNRPGTVDSVMSERGPSRAHSSNTVVLPKISQTSVHQNLPPLEEMNESAHVENYGDTMPNGDEVQYDPPVHQSDMPAPSTDDIQSPNPVGANGITAGEGMEEFDFGDVNTDAAVRQIENMGEDIDGLQAPYLAPLAPDTKSDAGNYGKHNAARTSRMGSRQAVPMAMATGVSLLDDLVPSAHTPKSAPSISSHRRLTPPGELAKPQPPAQLAPLSRSASFEQMQPGDKVHTPPPGSACGHSNAGQELCYLCHQRARRNVPVTFMEERRQREAEEDRLLTQYQYMKDAEDTLNDQEKRMARRQNLEKLAAFNLGASEAILDKKRSRDTEFQKSYIFQRRPLTPPRIIKQNEYSGDLAKQVAHKETTKKKKQTDEEFIERLEQVQLAEDLAIQREALLREKAEEQERYKKALETQLAIKYHLDKIADEESILQHKGFSDTKANFRVPVSGPVSQTLRPFGSGNEKGSRMNEDWKTNFGRLRFKPLQVPAREPDKEVFGKNDMTNEKMADRRRRAYELYQDQQELVAQKKREAIVKRLAEQKADEQTLEQTKQEMMDDRANRFGRRLGTRKRLEEDWLRASLMKRDRMQEDKIRALSPGLLLHEQCDKYTRCGQCKRTTKNCGESNLWSESRYIPGSRLMV